ncbi:recombinase family protein [Streptomyces niveus]
MTADLVQRAHWGNFEGLSFAGLARLSTEEAEGKNLSDGRPDGRRRAPLTGADIKSTEEQEKDGRRFVTSRGGEYVYTYMEPDTSAWKRRRVVMPDGSISYRVVRPIYEGSLEDLKKGYAPNGRRMDGLIVYDIDRLTRDLRHLEDAIEVVQHYGRPIIDITGSLDLLTDNGRSMARVMVTMANKASADTARRLRRNHEARRNLGIPAGGTRPFGWKEDKRTLHPEEAAILRKAVERVIEGAPLNSILSDWDRRGIRSASGKRWTAQSLKAVLRNPRICGFRSRVMVDITPETGTGTEYMAIAYDEEGNPIIGQWKPMISVAEWESVVAIIGEKHKRGTGHNSRVYLGTGTLRCGKCDARLRASKRHGVFNYGCPPKSTGRGCGGIRVAGPEVDDLIGKLVIEKYQAEAAARQAFRSPKEWQGEAELANLREDISDLKAAREARQISAQRYFAHLADYEAKEQEMMKNRNAWNRQALAGRGEPVNMAEEWQREDITLAERRAYVEQILTAVVVLPVGKGRRLPVRDRLVPIYVEE